MRDGGDLAEQFRDMIRDEVQKTMALRRSGRFALVDSVSPETQTAKVKFQPGDKLSGWLPYASAFASNGAGLATPPSPGDQVWVQFQEGSYSSGVITHRVWSEKDKALAAKSGEAWLVHGNGQSIKLLNDKTMAFGGQNSASQLFDADGNIVFSSKKHLQATTDGNIVFQPAQMQVGKGNLKPVKLADNSNSTTLFST